MSLVEALEFPEQKFSLYFLGFDDGGKSSQIELTHNWEQNEPYEKGSAFGHIAFGVDDIAATVERLREAGVPILREPGPVVGGEAIIAFISDPDGYKIELIENDHSA